MAQRLNGKLECAECGTTYLRVPAQLSSDSPIFCMTCGTYIGRGMTLSCGTLPKAVTTECLKCGTDRLFVARKSTRVLGT